MDGGIILSKDLKTIKFANVLLTPNSKIPTSETGTRHKAAERTAKQISGLAIAISEGRNVITLYYKDKIHKIKDVSEIVRKVNDYLQVLERQREIFDVYLETLNKLELKNYVNLNHAIKTVQKGKVIQKISEDSAKFLIEIGNEGSLLKTRLKEILHDVEKETNLIIRDYANIDYKKSINILDNLSYEQLLDKESILKAMNHESIRKIVGVSGWRILSKTTLSESEISDLMKEKDFFGKIVSSNIDQRVDSIPEEKFSSLKVELERLKLGI